MLRSFAARTRSLGSIVVLAIALGATSCTSSRQTANSSGSPNTTPTTATDTAQSTTGKPLVVATVPPVCDLTRQIAGDTVDLKCLIESGADPHEYQPKPQDRKAIEQAKLTLYGGYDFEPQLVKLIKATSNSALKVAVDEVAVPNPQQFEDEGKTVNDPHVFHTAQNGAKMAEVINKSLAQLQPNQASLYMANTKKLTTELTQLDSWIKSEIATIPAAQRKLVTTHNAFGYYSKAYGIPLEGALQGVSTEEKATPARVKDLVKSIKGTNVTTIFPEATVNSKLIQAVAREANVKVSNRELFADGLGEKGSEGDTYQKMLIANTKTIVDGLGGKYTPFQPK